MTIETLVRSAGSKSEVSLHEEWEPTFFDCGNDLCPHFATPALRRRYLNFLHYHVGKHKRDLLSHVHRILLARSDNRSDLVYTALTDIFVTLGNKGADLRADLLERCGAALTPSQIQALREKLEEVTDSPNSSINLPLVSRIRPSSNKVEKSLLEEVHEYLEEGQVELAQSLLEQALPEEPGNLELTSELHEIYRRSRDSEAAVRMLANLGPLDVEARKLWDDLLGSLGI